MIVSKLEKYPDDYKMSRVRGKIRPQKCDVICDSCKKEYDSFYSNILSNRKKYEIDLCRGCKQKHQYKNGLREKQREYITSYAFKFQKGKTFEELYGDEKAKKLKKEASIKNKGENNCNFGGTYKGTRVNLKGKTFRQIYGEDKAKEIGGKLSLKCSGKNNPMYGKPAPVGSGNGWSGWYKDWYFRSITELSYMINVIERNNWSWENAEKKKYKVPYKLDGVRRNYFSDFIVNNKTMIEIKPGALRNSYLVKIKEEAAIKWCKENNLEYKIIDNTEFDRLSLDQIADLRNANLIKFIDRYEKKFKEIYK